MPAQESRRLWCFLEDQGEAYQFSDISLDTNVYELKEGFDHLDADRLKLWKLNKTFPIDPDHSLAKRLADMGDIAMYSKLLHDAEKVGDLFPEPHSEDHLHIVVQIEPSTSRKRSRSAAEEDGRAAKRKQIEEVWETESEMGDSPDVETRCVALHEAIKAMPDNLDLSNPSTFTTLPFPSPLMPTRRFEMREINGINHFEYMGRSRFCELQKRVEEKRFLDMGESLYLFGTSGSGKSHFLAALAYHLIREGKRVIYIPDCLTFLLNPAQTLWTALNFVFYDSPYDLETIIDPHNIDEMILFMKSYPNLYVIIDQVDVLDSTLDDIYRQRKVQIVTWIDALRSDNRYIFSASADELSHRDADRKQSGISFFRVFGGMNKDETDQWFIHYAHKIPQLSAVDRRTVEYDTGCVPLLLRCVINIKKFVEYEFENITDFVRSDVDEFFRNKFYSLNPLSKKTCLFLLRDCVESKRRVMSLDRDLYDLRYFYVDEEGIGHCTCGIAEKAMTKILQEHDKVELRGEFPLFI